MGLIRLKLMTKAIQESFRTMPTVHSHTTFAIDKSLYLNGGFVCKVTSGSPFE